MVDLFLSMCSIPSWRICFKFWYATIKRGRQLEVNAKWTMMQLKLCKVRVVLGVLGHAESGYSIYFRLYLFFTEVFVIFCRNPWQLFQNFHVFLIKTGQTDFAELCPFRNQWEIQWILDSFKKIMEKEETMVYGPKLKSKNLILY